ncbi:MAG TPA: LamG-like jellyroll fold domain-containing protein [Bacillota bacterium]|nr:LamG-like jellyroll fold domain-containing protein [Bacillota bacterium]
MPKRKTVLFICVAMLLLSLSICNQILFANTLPITGLVAYYPFNGNANDESGNGNHGAVYGGATLTTDRFGNANSAYSFDGINDYIRVPNKNILNFGAGDFSISVFIDIRDVAYEPQSPGASIINKRWTPEYYTSGWNQWDLVYSFDNNTLGFWTYSYDYSGIASENNIQYNKYYHLVAIRNREKMSIYLNGILVSQNTCTIRDLSNPMDIFIGVDGRHLLVNYDSKYYFDGVIDDIRLYNRALSASEVQTLYNEGGWPTPNLLSNPDFNNGIEDWHCVNNTINVQANLSWDTADYSTAPGSLKVQCYNNGDSYTDIQLLNSQFNLIKDQTYLLTFKAKSSAEFSIHSIKLNQAGSPWTDYADPYTRLTINTIWRDYAAIFTANATVSDARVTFFLGGAISDGATFNLDDVNLKEFVANPPTAGELLANPSFELGNSSWSFYSDPTAQAYGYLDPSDFDTAPVSYRIECIQSGGSMNAVQLFTMPFNIEANKNYQLTFKAKCSSNFAIPSIRLMKATSPWTIYAWPLGVASINTEWQTYSVNFTAYTTASDGRLTFFLGNALPPGAVFWIDSVSLNEVGQ